jgi:hypothetical protein
MAISIDERREISRRNGAKSRGPVTDAGKAISSRNSTKHGFYAKVHNLPDESREETDRLRARWYGDVAPKTVVEEFLTEDCFQANLRANRVHRAYRALVARQQDAATAPWHDRRDDEVGRLLNELREAADARSILTRLRSTSLGLAALSREWGLLGAVLEQQGYWLPEDLNVAVLLSGVPLRPTMFAEDEDAYRLHLWNLQCEPEPPRETIEQVLKPANRPPGLRGADLEVLLPAAAECLERLKLWVADVRAELEAESEWVETKIEAPELARRTAPRAVIIDPDEERRINRASSEYRAMFYKAHKALEAIRKREAAEAREAAQKDVDRGDSRRSSDREDSAGRAGDAAPTPVAAPTDTEQQPAQDGPVAPACKAEVEAEPRNEPSSRSLVFCPSSVSDADARPRNEPSSGTETPVMADVTVPLEMVETDAPDESSTRPDDRVGTPAPNTVVARSPDSDAPVTGGLETGPRPATEERLSRQPLGPETRAERGPGPSQGRAATRNDRAPGSHRNYPKVPVGRGCASVSRSPLSAADTS